MKSTIVLNVTPCSLVDVSLDINTSDSIFNILLAIQQANLYSYSC
jgi:hypothetical protein